MFGARVLNPKLKQILICSILGKRLTTKTSPEIETSARKCENFRIGIFYPLSFPDFGCSAGHSILRLLQRGRKSPPYTVVCNEKDIWPSLRCE